MNVPLICAVCDASFELRIAEVNRQQRKGRTKFFCSRTCAAMFNNDARPNRVRPEVKICPLCEMSFVSTTSKKAGTFCSRSCASRGSVTARRREASRASSETKKNFSTETTAKGLRKREGWKYALIEKFFVDLGEPFQFEFPVGGYVFDLVLPARLLLVEFDGQYHRGQKQIEIDEKKEKVAAFLGWGFRRVEVTAATVIPVESLLSVL